jgi:hypothetical protein
MDEWTQEDQDRAANFRRELATDIQRSRRDGHLWAAWCLDKLANMVLWIEREGKRLMRGV